MIEGLNINLPPGSIERAAKALGIDLQKDPLIFQSPAQQIQAMKHLEEFLANTGFDSDNLIGKSGQMNQDD